MTENKNTAPIAAIYARYSSANQRDASIEDQLRVCREYCEKNGLTIVKEFCDHALTGRTDQRPAFLEMVSFAERKAFKVLVLYAMDRLSRDKYDLVFYKRRLEKAGVRIVYVTQPIGEGAEARLMESLLEGMAAYYSENLARSVRRGLEGNALKGIVTTGRAPFGYRLTEERRLEPDPMTAPVVSEIFERYAKGETRRSIIADLNRRGYTTTLNNPFTPSSLDTVLKNEAYLGVFHWADVRLENDHRPLVSEALFSEAQRMIARKAISKTGETATEYLLTGRFFCESCGSWIVGDCATSRTGAVYRYYTCSNHKRRKGCPMPSFKKDEVEKKILRACAAALTDDAIAEISLAAEAYAQKEAKREDPRPALKKSLADVNKRLNNLMAAIEQGIITPTTKQRLADLEEQQRSLTAQLSRADVARPALTATHFAAYLRPLQKANLDDPNDQRKLINTLLNRATLRQDKTIALLLNLRTSATVNLSNSDLQGLVDLTRQHPNQVIIWRYCVFLIL